jgi:tRNA A37 threonylcarbamoyladenosine synthetase subunit TsaC/SUA5/YrdC
MKKTREQVLRKKLKVAMAYNKMLVANALTPIPLSFIREVETHIKKEIQAHHRSGDTIRVRIPQKFSVQDLNEIFVATHRSLNVLIDVEL